MQQELTAILEVAQKTMMKNGKPHRMWGTGRGPSRRQRLLRGASVIRNRDGKDKESVYAFRVDYQRARGMKRLYLTTFIRSTFKDSFPHSMLLRDVMCL